MDAPQHNTFENLIKLAEDRKGWKADWNRRHPPPPKSKPKKTGKRKQKKKPQSKSESTGLINVKRSAWTHPHYIIHHGSADDAKFFLKHPTSVKLYVLHVI